MKKLISGWGPWTYGAGAWLFVWVLGAIFASSLAPFDFDVQDMNSVLMGPSREHLMGTDRLGRDIFSRLLFGARMSLAVGVGTAVASLLIGTIVGGVAGWYGGWVDRALMSFIDVIYGIPSLVILILVKMFFDGNMNFGGPEFRAFLGTFLALSFVGWMTMARVVRGYILQKKELLYVDAGRALGLPTWHLIWKTVIPNIWGPILALTTLRIPSNILLESFLSFIGLGLKPPYSSWGTMAADGVDSIETFPHLILFPGLVLFLALMAFQILGDGLKNNIDQNVGVNDYEKI